MRLQIHIVRTLYLKVTII